MEKERMNLISQMCGFRQTAKITGVETYEIEGGTKVDTHTIGVATLKAGLLFSSLINESCYLVDAGEFGVQIPAVINTETFTCAEIKTGADAFDLAIYDKKSGRVMAANYVRGNEPSEFIIARGQRCGTVVLLSMLPNIILENESVFEAFTKIKECGEDLADASLWEKVPFESKRKCAEFCDELYYVIRDGKYLEKIPDDGKCKKITLGALQSGSYTSGKKVQVYGTPEAFALKTKVKEAVKRDPKAIERKLKKYKEKDYSKEEKGLIPKIPTDRPIAEEALEIADDFYRTEGSPLKIFSVMLTGEPGTGKSTIAQDIAAILKRPFVRFSCGPNTTELDIIQKMMPNTEIAAEVDFPSVEDCKYSTAEAYLRLTGEEMPEGVDADEVIELLVSRALENKNDSKDFKAIDSPIVEAARKGYIVEVQEANLPKPTELEILNSLLEEGKMFLPSTGETLCVHPDFKIIFTMNLELEGTRNTNQALLDRCQESYDIVTPSVSEATERIVAKTGCKSKEFVEKCVEVQKNLENYLKKNYITDGVCGMRSTMSWVLKAMLCKDAKLAAKRTIIAKATMDIEVRDELFRMFIEEEEFPSITADAA